MGITERKEREKQELREFILHKAKEIIMAEGQDKLSIRRLAHEVEYSPATIYLYFRDKDEILYQMMNMGFEQMSEGLRKAFEESNPIERLYQVGEAYVQFGLTQSDWYNLMFNSASPIKHLIRCKEEWGAGIALFETITVAVKEALDLANLKDLDPRLTALQLWSNVHGLVNLALTQRLYVYDSKTIDPDFQNELIKKSLQNLVKSIFH
jgi:AcrR family transcriptional regulator